MVRRREKPEEFPDYVKLSRFSRKGRERKRRRHARTTKFFRLKRMTNKSSRRRRRRRKNSRGNTIEINRIEANSFFSLVFSHGKANLH